MSTPLEQVLDRALELTPDDRALLADRLIESLDPSDEGAFHSLWAAEARRRVEEVRAGRVRTIPGDEASARVRKLAL